MNYNHQIKYTNKNKISCRALPYFYHQTIPIPSNVRKFVNIAQCPPLLSMVDYSEIIDVLKEKNVTSIELKEKDKYNVEIKIGNGKNDDNNINYNYITIIISTCLLIWYIKQKITTITSISTLPSTTDITFDDVAGLSGPKQDLLEIVDFLKHPDKFLKLGAKIPKGCLLYGPSGLGKTLLAKAVAGEANVPFYAASGSDFIQMFAGVGAARIRELFENAKNNAPCIIFIDEIDTIGKSRGSSNDISNTDERDQTINSLLVEMDGFYENPGIIVIGATNRMDVLDPALLRPGRFDRLIRVDLPDLQDRIEILEYHTRDKPLDITCDICDIAKMATRFSGADLANLANEAAINAVRNDRSFINMDDFDIAFDKIILGGYRNDASISETKKELIAYHEAGHALVAIKIGDFDAIKKVTIIGRGDMGGITMFEPDEENTSLITKEYLQNQIAVALGGRIAEEIVYGKEKVSIGASSDLMQIQKIARYMVTHYGFSSEVLGPLAWVSSSDEYAFSEEMMAKIDNEIKNVVENIYSKTYELVDNNRSELEWITEQLLKKETLYASDLYDYSPNTIYDV
jgi:cell division protease FtsH